jgi:hypothetical protein
VQDFDPARALKSRNVQFRPMPGPTDAISVLVALEFVVTSLVVILLVPLEVAAPLVPLLLVFLLALWRYRS